LIDYNPENRKGHVAGCTLHWHKIQDKRLHYSSRALSLRLSRPPAAKILLRRRRRVNRARPAEKICY